MEKAETQFFAHLDRMQRRIMTKDSWITEEQFLTETPFERLEYYKWMTQQCGELADLI